jgi:signal transduction histidine kinase
MKHRLSRLSQAYAAALRKHLRQGPATNLRPAREFGRAAGDLGMETLDVAKIHARALATLEGASRDGIIKQAEVFFTEAITPIEKRHSAALKTKAHLNQVHEKLDQRTVDLAATNRFLKRSIARRKSAEKALEKSARDAGKLLEESRHLQKHLQRLTHRILAAQENKRKRISRTLQNEIAQTLLGINMRLFALRKEAAAEALQKEIAATRRLVDNSMKSIKGFAREFANYHEG